MVSIKGPRSALTDFIDEHGIKINKLKNKPQEIKKEKAQTKRKIINKTHKKSKPFELASKNNHSKSLQNILIRKILQNVNFYKLEDKHLEMISSFLSTNRSNNTELINIIINKYKEIITIYDCSMIKEEDYKLKILK
ncbi:uncharacterized protein VNE69_07108 [Vairimorpha necatrix]|uniref:Uncharacterized protein n=1 Tax=Vairimorpha necatrix TaxID=6039 RepID=A0AAX4JDF0_9MICR